MDYSSALNLDLDGEGTSINANWSGDNFRAESLCAASLSLISFLFQVFGKARRRVAGGNTGRILCYDEQYSQKAFALYF